MNKKLFIGLVVLMSLALLGIIGMQYFWFRNSIRVKQAEFKMSVNDAMRTSAMKLENREILQKILSPLNTPDTPVIKKIARRAPGRNEHPDIVNNQNQRRPDGIVPEQIAGVTSEVNVNNLPALPIDSKDATVSGANSKYSKNIDSIAFAEEMAEQVYRYAEHLRRDTDQKQIQDRIAAQNDSIQRLNRNRSGGSSTVDKPSAPQKKSKIFIDGKEIREPSLNDINIFRKVIGDYYHSRPNLQPFPGRQSPFDAFRAQLSRYPGRISDSLLKVKTDSFIKKNYNNPANRLTRAEYEEFVKKTYQQFKKQGLSLNNIRLPFFDDGRYRDNRMVSSEDTLVQNRVKHLTSIIDQIILEVSTDHSIVSKRISTRQVDSVLMTELKNNGVILKPEYAVYNDLKQRQSSIASPGFDSTQVSDYVTRLFPNDLFGSPYSLKLQFKDKDAYILKSMIFMLSGSVLLTIFLILAFIFALWAIIKQKKISEIRSDFINNITHEFKTPISTIGLAIDAIDNPKIIDNKKQVQYFTQIIREENYRMNQLVENVLRAALLDRKNLKQNIDDVDLHALIQKAVNHTQLQIESRKGKLQVHLDAEDSIIEADAAQVLNAIMNLIDNAIKYSKDAPDIIISTRQSGNRIICAIEDKGIGMSHEVQRKIFDRFYRYTEGNIHDVKGHGLGLAFVKAIVDAHNGRISVESELGKGSRFEVIIPLKSAANEE